MNWMSCIRSFQATFTNERLHGRNLLSNGAYVDLMPRMAGLFIFVLGESSPSSCARDYRYYLYIIVTSSWRRCFFVVVITALYFNARPGLLPSAMWLWVRNPRVQAKRFDQIRDPGGEMITPRLIKARVKSLVRVSDCVFFKDGTRLWIV